MRHWLPGRSDLVAFSDARWTRHRQRVRGLRPDPTVAFVVDLAAFGPDEREGPVAVVGTAALEPDLTTGERIHRFLQRLGIDIVRYPGRGTVLGRRMQLLRTHRIDVIMDVGANVGQYGQELRELGFKGRIVSFEPLPPAFAELARRSGRDAAWQAVQLAIGDHHGQATMHVAANSVSSSILGMLPAHLEAAPYSHFVGDIQVEMVTLSEAIDRYVRPDERLLVKVDAQGYEAQILAGAADGLDRIEGFQLELSIVPLYEGSATLAPLIGEAERLGFTLMSIEPGFSDQRSGRLLQADGLFLRARS